MLAAPSPPPPACPHVCRRWVGGQRRTHLTPWQVGQGTSVPLDPSPTLVPGLSGELEEQRRFPRLPHTQEALLDHFPGYCPEGPWPAAPHTVLASAPCYQSPNFLPSLPHHRRGGGYSGFPAQASPCPHLTACWAGPHPRRLASAPQTGPKAWGAQRGPWKGFRLVHPTSQRAQQPDKTSLRRRVAAGAAPAPLAPRGGGIAAHTPTPLPTLDAVSSTSFFKQGHLVSSQGDRLLGMNLHVPMKAPADMNWAAKATLTWLRVSG